MQKPTIYIAGKVTGVQYATATAKFGEAQAQLKAAGYLVANPIQFVAEQYTLNDINNGAVSWGQIMQLCVHKLTMCQGLLLLPCWAQSRGAILERYIAVTVGMPVAEHITDLLNQVKPS